MKRYRVLPFFDFDMRVRMLVDPIQDHWEDAVEEMHKANRNETIASLREEFGERNSDFKIQNFIDLEAKPISVLAFHNTFFSQVRTAFVMGAYYPALTGACALGERILNHLLLMLRNDYRHTPEYRHVYRKNSFDDWSLAINTLESWEVLLPNSSNDFRTLMDKRHRAIHFRPEIDTNVRSLSLDAISCLQRIIGEQFCGFGPQPWFITGIPGEIYIKKDWETKPFIRHVYLPNATLVGPRNRIDSMVPKISIVDPDFNIELGDCSDEEFEIQRRAFNDGVQQP